MQKKMLVLVGFLVLFNITANAIICPPEYKIINQTSSKPQEVELVFRISENGCKKIVLENKGMATAHNVDISLDGVGPLFTENEIGSGESKEIIHAKIVELDSFTLIAESDENAFTSAEFRLEWRFEPPPHDLFDTAQKFFNYYPLLLVILIIAPFVSIYLYFKTKFRNAAIFIAVMWILILVLLIPILASPVLY